VGRETVPILGEGLRRKIENKKENHHPWKKEARTAMKNGGGGQEKRRGVGRMFSTEGEEERPTAERLCLLGRKGGGTKKKGNCNRGETLSTVVKAGKKGRNSARKVFLG